MEIVEVGPRDGLQNEKRVLSTAVKVSYVRRAIEAGLRRIEVAAFARPDRVPQMADAEEVLRAVPRTGEISYIALILNGKGLDRALALEDARPDEINYVVVASDEFSRRNQGMSTADSLAAFGKVADKARNNGLRVTLTIAAAFGCPFTGEVDIRNVGEIAQGAGVLDEICLADTIGVGVPHQVAELVDAVKRDGVTLRAHFHNTRNTGYANAVAAVRAGVEALDSSIGGIGGCPFAPAATGNIATEDLAYLLRRSKVETGVDVTRAATAGVWIGERLGLREVPAQLGRAGDFPLAS
ncbi:hydroxymethylglutaryl-CoA lyase [Actinoplanes sp. NPDC051851]|uniref:hydroxymethylglutaryl-CoA lyase n=1 Tax=Actinoplanes sp. NPDC051851 TaxID=3154753 RepID=UPI003439318F